MIGGSENFGDIGFRWWQKETMLYDDLTCSGNEFQRVGTATEKTSENRWTEFSGLGC